MASFQFRPHRFTHFENSCFNGNFLRLSLDWRIAKIVVLTWSWKTANKLKTKTGQYILLVKKLSHSRACRTDVQIKIMPWYSLVLGLLFLSDFYIFIFIGIGAVRDAVGVRKLKRGRGKVSHLPVSSTRKCCCPIFWPKGRRLLPSKGLGLGWPWYKMVELIVRKFCRKINLL